MINRLRTFLISAVLLTAGPAAAWAQSSPLTLQLRPLSTMARSGGPITLVWELDWQGTTLLEGPFEIVVRDGRQQFSSFRTHDVVLSTGRNSFHTMMPPIDSHDLMGQQVELDVTFIGKQRRISLGKFPLRVPGPRRRSLTVCVCIGGQSRETADQGDVTAGLQFEQFSPRRQNAPNVKLSGAAIGITTTLARIDPVDMPATALGYCGFDMVLLMDEGFSQLKQRQIKVLMQWVQAGGSLCVLPSGRIDTAHRQFLNDLISGGTQTSPFLTDSEGSLVPPDDGKTTWLRHKGVGRTAVAYRGAGDGPATGGFDVKSQQWRALVAFLWKIRRDQAQLIAVSGSWSNRAYQGNTQRVVNGQYVNAANAFTVFPIGSGTGLLDRLMPDNIRVVPFALIGLILFFYVIAIGPGDYFLLGFFKQRKWTWALFPAVTIGFALFTVWLSNNYMSGSSGPKTLVIRDIGDGGSIARENRLELVFKGRGGKVETKARRELFAALNHQNFSDRYSGRQQQGLVKPPKYVGRLPTEYTVTQDVPQWTPQVNRRFAIAPDVEPVVFDWESVKPLVESSNRMELRDRIVQAFGANTSIYVLQNGRLDVIAGTSNPFARRYDQYGYDHGPQPGMVYEEGYGGQSTSFLQDLCNRPQIGLFSLVSQIAPTGAGNFEDLAITDPANSLQRLLVVLVESGDEIVMYRKLYTVERE